MDGELPCGPRGGIGEGAAHAQIIRVYRGLLVLLSGGLGRFAVCALATPERCQSRKVQSVGGVFAKQNFISDLIDRAFSPVLSSSLFWP
jgi:hypothetical protein